MTTALCARGRRIEQHRQKANEAFAAHQIEQRLDNGLFRSWRCQKPGEWAYGFDITTIPGSLIITGDIGELIVSRMPDMIPWCRGSINSIDYFAEKVPHGITVYEYDADVAKEYLDQEIADNYECGYDRYRAAKLKDLRCSFDIDNRELFLHEVYESGVFDGSDFPDFTNYCSRFLWCREAIRWLVERLP